MSETRKFRIYGASDDLIETEGLPGCDEFNVNPDPDEGGHAGTFVLAGPGGMMRLVAFYGLDGLWFFAPAQMDEGEPLPDWPIRVKANEPSPGRIGHSTELEVEVPEGTRLLREGP